MIHVINNLLCNKWKEVPLSKGKPVAWTSICVFTINSTYTLNDWLSHLSSPHLQY